jgi:hypothetical protein
MTKAAFVRLGASSARVLFTFVNTELVRVGEIISIGGAARKKRHTYKDDSMSHPIEELGGKCQGR